MPMTTAVKAIFEDGVFKPLEPLHLAELTQVEVLIPCPAAENVTDSVGLNAIDDLIGFIRNGLPDMAENHDVYLYGKPRE
jgi:predicted DNA-binding antitoxin AbrB/MazE fold protein